MNFFKKNFPIIIACIVLTVSSIIYDSSAFSYFTALFGIISVFLIGKKEWVGYIFMLINYAMYSYTLFNTGLLISGIYYVAYAIPMLLYGLLYWKRNTNIKEKLLPKSIKTLLYVFILLSLVGVFSNSTDKWFYDLIITLFGSFALILQARKYREQWIAWSFANLIGTFLWTGVFIENVYDISLFLMWSMYLINSIYFLLEPITKNKRA